MTEGGQYMVISGAIIAISGSRKSLTIPFFTCELVSDSMAMLVTSDPVPAVVGKAIKGIDREVMIFSPNNVSNDPNCSS